MPAESASINLIAPERHMRQQEPQLQPPMKSVTENQLKSSSVSEDLTFRVSDLLVF